MKIVVFSVADKVYGADISQVSEVIRMRKVTPVPGAANFIEGVISLRGKVIPLINLRKKLGLEGAVVAFNRIIVTKFGEGRLGILVDQVKDVVPLGPEEITRPDEVLQSARYLTGVAKFNGNLVLIVDLAELLKGEERETLQQVQERVEIKKKES
ncbi:MAG TPA: chemotaxis protein CheW [Candidatus Omnitrophota bacterium]|nr:chemotaxis protein CheW [Candidatus Omnitrophota bacterium]HPS36653.1 chemotaxis protein CheW [Candidatus Omnitrophota bacterium]